MLILNYKLFENILQADKYLKDKTDPAIFKYYERLKQILIDNKVQPLAFTFVKYYEQTKNVDEIFYYLDKIIKNNVKVDINNPIFKTYEGMKSEINYIIMKRDVMKFIEKYVPGFLKKEMKKPEIIKKLGTLIPNIKDYDKLRGMVALFKTANDYINYLENITRSSPIEELKASKDVEILKETDNYIIYSPKTFESMNIIVFPEWCTIDKAKYAHYADILGYKIYIYYDKSNILKSYVIMVNEFDFYASDYHNKTIFDIDNFEEKFFKLNNIIYDFVEIVKDYDSDFEEHIVEFV